MEQEMTMQELAAFINAQEGDFILCIELGEEADGNAGEE
jgi:hypothetical protein